MIHRVLRYAAQFSSFDRARLILIAGAGSALLLGLGWSPLFLYDESLYCGATADMDAHGTWLYPTDEGEFFAWYGKPPLVNWLQKLSTVLFGWSIWSLRLPTAVGMLALILLICRTGTVLMGRRLGLAAGALVLLSARMVHTGRHILLEDLVVPLFAASLLCWAHALEGQQRDGRIRWAYLAGAGACIAAAILTKQAFAAFAPVAIVIAESVLRRPGWLARLVLTGGTALAGAGWWFVASYWLIGQPFLDSIVGYHIQARFTQVLESHHRGLNAYVASLDDHLQVLPWSLGFLGWVMLWQALKRDEQRALYVAWSALCLVEYLVVGVAVRTFLPWYQLTLMPPLFLGSAYLLVLLWRLDSPLKWTGPVMVAAAAFKSARLDAFPALLLSSLALWWFSRHPRAPRWSSATLESAALSVVVVFGLVVANPFHGRDGRYRIAERVSDDEPVTVVGDEWRRVWMCYLPRATRIEWTGTCPPSPGPGWLILDGASSSCKYSQATVEFSGHTNRGEILLYRFE